MPASQKEFLTSRETAELLGVALSTVQVWTETGLLRAWKTGGGHRRIARQSVEQLLEQQRAAAGTISNHGQFTVAIVEDNPALLKLYQRQFTARELPVQLIFANNGFEGLIQIGRCLPDVVITDLLMPGMDGFQMIRSLNESPELSKSLILVVSALTEEEIRARGGLPEDISVFQKPIPFDILELLLRERLEEMSSLEVRK